MEGSFRVRKAGQIKKKKVLLIDDVYTTGATMSEARRILLLSGAESVVGLTVAKTVNFSDIVHENRQSLYDIF